MAVLVFFIILFYGADACSVKADGYDIPGGVKAQGAEGAPLSQSPSQQLTSSPQSDLSPAPASENVRALQEDAARKQLAADRASEAADLKAQAEAKEQRAEVLQKEAEIDRQKSQAAMKESDRVLQPETEAAAFPADGGYVNVDEQGNLKTEEVPEGAWGKGKQDTEKEASSGDGYQNDNPENNPEDIEAKKRKEESPTVTCERGKTWDDAICTREDGSQYNQKTKEEVRPADGYQNDNPENNLEDLGEEALGEADSENKSEPEHSTEVEGVGASEPGAQDILYCERRRSGLTRKVVCEEISGRMYEQKTGKEISPSSRSKEEVRRLLQIKKEREEKNPTIECKFKSFYSSARTCKTADGSEYNEKTGKQTKRPTHTTGGVADEGIEVENPTISCKKIGISKTEICERANGIQFYKKTGKIKSGATRTKEEAKKKAEESYALRRGKTNNSRVKCFYKNFLARTRVCEREDDSRYDEQTGKELKPPNPAKDSENPIIRCKKMKSTGKEVCMHADGSMRELKSNKEISPATRSPEETKEIADAYKKNAKNKGEPQSEEDECVYENPESRTRTCTRPDGTKYDEESGAEFGSEEDESDDEDDAYQIDDADEEDDDKDDKEDEDEEKENEVAEKGPDDEGTEDEVEPNFKHESRSRNIGGEIGDEEDLEQAGDGEGLLSKLFDRFGNRVTDEEGLPSEEDEDIEPERDVEDDVVISDFDDLSDVYENPKRVKWGGAAGDQEDVGGSTSFLGDENLATQVVSGSFDRVTKQNSSPVIPLKTGYVQPIRKPTKVNPYKNTFMRLGSSSRYEP